VNGLRYPRSRREATQLFIGQAARSGSPGTPSCPCRARNSPADFSPSEWQVVEATLEQAENVRVITENGSREDAYLDCGWRRSTVPTCSSPYGTATGPRQRGHRGRDRLREVDRQADPDRRRGDRQMRRENWSRLERGDEGLANLNHLPTRRPRAPATLHGAGHDLQLPEEVRPRREPGRPAV